jgi:hypothetical protein
MTETTRSISEIHDAAGPTDATAHFERLHKEMQICFDRLADRFELNADPSVADFESYGGPTGPTGTLNAYTGPEVDWLIHSHIGDPVAGFTNLHLTCWLGPQIKVPHFGMAWGTLPDFWYFVDYTPRSDLQIDLESLDRYYAPDNDEYMALRDEPGFSPFVSQALYVRQAVSHTAHCFVVENTDDRLDRMVELANAKLGRWLDHVDAAEPTPPEERAALAARDLDFRRTIAERDPANNMAVRYFGEEMTDRLVRSLWGGDRVLPRQDATS